MIIQRFAIFINYLGVLWRWTVVVGRGRLIPNLLLLSGSRGFHVTYYFPDLATGSIGLVIYNASVKLVVRRNTT